MSVLSPAAVMVCGYWGQCAPVWVLALFRIKRLIKEAIEIPSSPIAAVQETGQLLSIYCPTRLFKIQFQDNLETPPGLIMCSLAVGKFLSGFALGTITGRTFCGSHKIPFNDTALRLQDLRVAIREKGKVSLSIFCDHAGKFSFQCWDSHADLGECRSELCLWLAH